MMNPDGVFLGNTRGNLLGQDLNRRWPDPDKFAHPTVFAAKQLIEKLDSNGLSYDNNEDEADLELDTVLDIHSHSSLRGVFVYGNSYDDVYRYERHLVISTLLGFV